MATLLRLIYDVFLALLSAVQDPRAYALVILPFIATAGWYYFSRLRPPLSPVESNLVKQFLRTQLEYIKQFTEFDVDPDTGFIDSPKQIPQQFRHLAPRSFFRRRTLTLRGFVDLVSQPSENVYAIIGDPASGKTMELLKTCAVLSRRWLDWRHAWRHRRLPLPILVFVNSLPDAIWRDGAIRLEDIVLRYLAQLNLVPGPRRPPIRISSDFVNFLEGQWGETLHPVLLFDGIDEFADKRRYDDLVKLISQEARQLARRKTSVVISCRRDDYSRYGNFIDIEILALSQRHILRHYEAALGERLARTVKRSLGDSLALSHLSHYLTNVYFLRLYLDRSIDERGVPHPPAQNLDDLFEHMFLRDLKKLWSTADPNGALFLRDALAPIAYALTLMRVAPAASAPETHAAVPAVGLEFSSIDLIRSAVTRPSDVQRLGGWRAALWDYVQARDRLCLIKLCSELGNDQFAADLLANDPFRGADTARCAKEIESRLAAADLELPEREHEVVTRNLAVVLADERLPVEREFAAFQIALTFRALGLATRAAILRTDPNVGLILRFRHQRIREYLAARHIDSVGLKAFLDRGDRYNLWWRQTINMLGAVTRDPRQLLSGLLGRRQ